jgi:hypothetical protein
VNTYNPPAGTTKLALVDLLIAADGTLYMAGHRNEPGPVFHSNLFRSRDGGLTLEIVDDYLYAAGKNTFPAGLLQDKDGRFWATYTATDASGKARLIIRTSTDGTTWTTSEDFSYVSGKDTWPSVISQGANGSIYLGLSAEDSGGTQHCIIRKLACQPY